MELFLTEWSRSYIVLALVPILLNFLGKCIVNNDIASLIQQTCTETEEKLSNSKGRNYYLLRTRIDV